MFVFYLYKPAIKFMKAFELAFLFCSLPRSSPFNNVAGNNLIADYGILQKYLEPAVRIRTSDSAADDSHHMWVGNSIAYHRGMAVGDEVTFECELEPLCRRRRRCPEAHRVELLARAWTRYRRPYGAL